MCHPDDHLFARSTGDTRRTALESDRVREVSALRDHRVFDVGAPTRESARDPLERVSHGLRAVLPSDPTRRTASRPVTRPNS